MIQEQVVADRPDDSTEQPTVDPMVSWFRQSAPYINAHRGRTFVLMLSGDAIADANFVNIVHDIALLNSLGVRLVLALGARPQIDGLMQAQGIEAEFHQGLRITRSSCLEVVKQAVGVVRAQVEARLSTGLANSPMHGSGIRVLGGNFITAKPIGVRDGVDFCFTGEVRKVQARQINQALDNGAIVVLPCLGYSPSGEIFNLSVEDIATRVAIGVKADKLIAFSKESGVLDSKGELCRELRPADSARLLNNAELGTCFRQSLRACYNAVEEGLPRAHIVSYTGDGALLGELFTRDGTGTLITRGSYEQIRPATVDDVGGILELIRPLEASGVLVRRSRDLLENEIHNFTVVERDGMVVSCIAKYTYAGEACAEVACVVTHPEYQGANRAAVLLEHVEQQAKEAGLKQLFVLTTRTAHWFLEKGFAEASFDALPVEKKALYNFQRNSKIFIKQI